MPNRAVVANTSRDLFNDPGTDLLTAYVADVEAGVCIVSGIRGLRRNFICLGGGKFGNCVSPPLLWISIKQRSYDGLL